MFTEAHIDELLSAPSTQHPLPIIYEPSLVARVKELKEHFLDLRGKLDEVSLKWDKIDDIQ